MKLKTAILRFDRQLAANGRSVHTRAAYRRDLAALAGWLGVPPIRLTPHKRGLIFSQVDIAKVQDHQRPKPDTGAEKKLKDQVVAGSQRTAVAAHDLSQPADFLLGQSGG